MTVIYEKRTYAVKVGEMNEVKRYTVLRVGQRSALAAMTSI